MSGNRMSDRPEPLELAKRATTSITEIGRAEAARLRRVWDETFGCQVLEHTGKHIYAGYRWHAFSWEFVRAENGERAIELYAAERSAELFVLPEDDGGPAFELGGCAPIDFGLCGRDLYVVPATLDWTMAFTHEQPEIGPFFCRRSWGKVDARKGRRSVPVNCVYFACVDHRKYVDAGYRWAYWTLEQAGVVQKDHDVDIERLLSVSEYWNPPDEERSAWLCSDVLPTVRSFLLRHAGHRIVYVDEDRFARDWEMGYEWREARVYDDEP